MIFFIGFLTVVLVLDCLLLILLVLIQLPKKEAGAGVAFGGAATDALFGAGTGNVLTKITKWGTGVFFALLIVIGVLQTKYYLPSATKFTSGVDAAGRKIESTAPAGVPPTAPAPPLTVGTNFESLTATNAIPSPETSAPAPPK
jgi:preprotein translocase subunit SecG